MKKVFFYHIDSQHICIAEEAGQITDIGFSVKHTAFDGTLVEETELTRKAAGQLREYFAGKREKFDLPLAPVGTPFQQRVWNALMEIPYGQTRSYGEIARTVGNPKASRAVGMANNRNPVAIVIPCHRVIGSNGKLTGYAGGLELKDALLHLERAHADKFN